MRPDVAPLGALMFPTALLAPTLRTVAGSHPHRSSLGICRSSLRHWCRVLPRSGVLSRHGTNVQVNPRDYRRRRASPWGWRDRCRSRGLAPVGAVRGNPCGQLRPANSIPRL